MSSVPGKIVAKQGESVGRIVRNVLLTALGLACVAIGYINIAIPGAPSTVFFLIALWAFSLGNPKLENWMLTNRMTGPVLRHWRAHRAMQSRHKVIAISMVWVGILGSIAMIASRGLDPARAAIWGSLMFALLCTAVILTVVLYRIRTLD